MALDVEFNYDMNAVVPLRSYGTTISLDSGKLNIVHTIETPYESFYITVETSTFTLFRISKQGGSYARQHLVFNKSQFTSSDELSFVSDYYTFNNKMYLIIGGKGVLPVVFNYDDALGSTSNLIKYLINYSGNSTIWTESVEYNGTLFAGVYQITVYRSYDNVIRNEEWSSYNIPIATNDNDQHHVINDNVTMFNTNCSIQIQLKYGSIDKYKVLIKRLSCNRNPDTYLETDAETTYYLSDEISGTTVSITDEFVKRCAIIDDANNLMSFRFNELSNFCIYNNKLIAQLNTTNTLDQYKLCQMIANGCRVEYSTAMLTREGSTMIESTNKPEWSTAPNTALIKRYFKPNEVYALYLGIKLKGQSLRWYHIPGSTTVKSYNATYADKNLSPFTTSVNLYDVCKHENLHDDLYCTKSDRYTDGSLRYNYRRSYMDTVSRNAGKYGVRLRGDHEYDYTYTMNNSDYTLGGYVTNSLYALNDNSLGKGFVRQGGTETVVINGGSYNVAQIYTDSDYIRHHQTPPLSWYTQQFANSVNHGEEIGEFVPNADYLMLQLQVKFGVDYIEDIIPDIDYFCIGHAVKTVENSRNLGMTPVQFREFNNQPGIVTAGNTNELYPLTRSNLYSGDDTKNRLGLGEAFIKGNADFGCLHPGVASFAADGTYQNVASCDNTTYPNSSGKVDDDFYQGHNGEKNGYSLRGLYIPMSSFIGDTNRVDTNSNRTYHTNKSYKYDKSSAYTDLVISVPEWYTKQYNPFTHLEIQYIGRDPYREHCLCPFHGSPYLNLTSLYGDERKYATYRTWGEPVDQKASSDIYNTIRVKSYKIHHVIPIKLTGKTVAFNAIAVNEYTEGTSKTRDVSPIGYVFRVSTNQLGILTDWLETDDCAFADMISDKSDIHAKYITEQVVRCSDYNGDLCDHGDCVLSNRQFNRYIGTPDDNLHVLSDATNSCITTVHDEDTISRNWLMSYGQATNYSKQHQTNGERATEGWTASIRAYFGNAKHNTNLYMYASRTNGRLIDVQVVAGLLFDADNDYVMKYIIAHSPSNFNSIDAIDARDKQRLIVNAMRTADNYGLKLLKDQWVRCVMITKYNVAAGTRGIYGTLGNFNTNCVGGYSVCDVDSNYDNGDEKSNTFDLTQRKWASTSDDAYDSNTMPGFAYFVHVNKPILCEYPVIEQTNFSWASSIKGEFSKSSDATKSAFYGCQPGFIAHYRMAIYETLSRYNLSNLAVNDNVSKADEFQTIEQTLLYVSDGVNSERTLGNLFNYQINNYIQLPSKAFELRKLLVYMNNVYIFCSNASFIMRQQQEMNTNVDSSINVSMMDLTKLPITELLYDKLGTLGLSKYYDNAITPFGICQLDRNTNKVYMIGSDIKAVGTQGTLDFLDANLNVDWFRAYTNAKRDKLYISTPDWTLSFYPTEQGFSAYSFHKFRPKWTLQNSVDTFMLNGKGIRFYLLDGVTPTGTDNGYGMTDQSVSDKTWYVNYKFTFEGAIARLLNIEFNGYKLDNCEFVVWNNDMVSEPNSMEASGDEAYESRNQYLMNIIVVNGFGPIYRMSPNNDPEHSFIPVLPYKTSDLFMAPDLNEFDEHFNGREIDVVFGSSNSNTKRPYLLDIKPKFIRDSRYI
jgi:hypothetical protein